MRLSYITKALSLILKDIGLVVFIPVIVALYYHDLNSCFPFIATGVIALFISCLLNRAVKHASVESLNDIKKSEALMIVSLAWLVFALVSTIPYLFFGLSPIDSLFEAVSGITTTGATVLQRFDYPKAMMFWRSFTQWLGGMGIIVLFVAILPQFAVAGRQMFFAEAPGPTEDKFTPRIKNTASALWVVYAGLTLLCIFCLWLAGMNPFDAVCNSLSTLSAGGFSPNPESIQGYHSEVINWIIIIFMFIAGTSFVLQSRVLTKRKLSLFWKSEEFRVYLFTLLFFSGLLSVNLIVHHSYNFYHSITSAFYQVLAVATSTGSSSDDYHQWCFSAKLLLFMCMFISSCSGSAGGGIKITRWILIFKYIKNELYKILHPNAVLTIKIDGKVVAFDVLRQTLFFVFCYFGIAALIAFLLTWIEQDIVIGVTASISAIGDIGPGFGTTIGPMGNYSSLHSISKFLYISLMLIGRLEIIPFLVLFHKDFWRIK